MTKQNQRNTTALNDETSKSTNTQLIMANGGVTKAKRTRRTVPRDSPPQRSSIYRGVTRHRWTGRYEAHLWDKNCWNESQNKKGRQVYLGAYDDEDAAAHAYDLAALKYWGKETILNFPLSTYQKEFKEMEGQSREEYIGSLRRKSSGFSRGVSKYRGVARHHHNGRWEARIGRVFGNKYLYLGTYATQEEAAIAYDMAAIEYRGLNAVTNFDLSRYIKWLKPNEDDNNNNIVVANSSSENHLANPNLKIHYSIDNNNSMTTAYTHNNQQSSANNAGDNLLGFSEPAVQPKLRPATATSALGLLLQSSKFREMMEMTTAADSSSSNPDQGLEHNPRCSFPEEIQTYFEGHEEPNYFGEEEDMLFGGLNSFAPPLFQCDFDV